MGSRLRRNNVARIGRIVTFIVIFAFGIFMALPLIYSILQSLKPFDELFIYPPKFFPKRPSFDNYVDLFSITSNSWVPFSRYIFNSVWVTVVSTILQILAACMAAYPLALHEFPGKKLMNNIIVWSLLFNATVTALPAFIVLAKLNLIDNPLGLIIPTIGSSFALFLMINFMVTINPALLEAARIDGATEFQTLWKVAFPMVKPAYMTLAIFAFQGCWNSVGATPIYTEVMKLLPTALSQIMAAGNARVGASAASQVILIIPPIVFFIIAQSNTVETMSHAGIKG